MKPLTPTQQATLLEIHHFQHERGYMPTYQELAKARNRAVAPTQLQVELLRDAGYLQYESGKKRSRELRFARAIESNGCRIPILGTCN